MQRRDLERFCFAIGWAATLSGCMVWPTMIRPAVQLSIRDPQGQPIEGASFHFAKYSISMVPRTHVSTIATDELGAVAFDSERKWQFFFLAPDSGQFWSWSWCIEKTGFQAVFANDLRTDSRARSTTIVLTPTTNAERCRWRERPPAFEAERGAL